MMIKKIAGIVIGLVIAGSTSAIPALAATPDGMGPWADTVVNFSQGLQNNGAPVAAIRSNPTAALGVAEMTAADGTFASLGFKGKLTLGFDNGISHGVFAVESTRLPYPVETAMVELSSDGVHWVTAGNVSRSGSVNQPAGVSCAHYVRITDTSNPALFEPTADGYDVDGVEAQAGNSCTTVGRMTGGGSVFTSDGTRVTHGFELHCNVSDGSNNLEVNWGKGNNFHLDKLTSALCSDDPKIDPTPPSAGFDTYVGKGTGSLNNVAGYTAEWTFTDAGEPGKNDSANIVIKDPSNAVVLTVSGLLHNGNQQAHN